MHNLLKMLFLVLAACLAQSSLAGEGNVPDCFAYSAPGAAACRLDAAVAPIENKFFVWGGRQTLGCPTCDHRQQGLNSGGLYDRSGRLIEAFPTADGPGARFGAQAIWNRAALFIWGGIRRQDERWLSDERRYEIHSVDIPSVNSYYLPGARRWVRMTVTDAPPVASGTVTRGDGTRWKIVASTLELTNTGKVQACWNETPEPEGTALAFCRVFNMPSNTWGAKTPR